MSAGQYRHRIRIEAPTRTTNAEGQQIISWPAATDPAFLTIWANVVISGADQAAHHQQQATYATAVIKVRSTSETRSVTPGMRVRFRGELYEIASAEDPEFRGIEVVIKATSIRAA